MTSGPLDEQGLPMGYSFKPDWEITPRDLKRKLDNPAERRTVVVLDVRNPDEWATCRIDGAELIPLGELKARVEELRDREDLLIVTHCHHGRRSLQAAAILSQHGFPTVLSLAGGIDLWSIDIDPRVPRY